MADLLADLAPYWHLVVKNGDFTFLLLQLILADEVADLLPDLPPYWHLVVKNGNFTFLLLQLILADEVADLLVDLHPPVQCIIRCLLWDVIGSHCGFFQKRWEFAFISE